MEGKIRSFLVLQPRNDAYDALVAFFKANDVLGKAIRHAGAYACEVHIPVARTGPVIVTAIWDSEEAYAGWRNHPVRDELAPAISSAGADDLDLGESWVAWLMARISLDEAKNLIQGGSTTDQTYAQP